MVLHISAARRKEGGEIISHFIHQVRSKFSTEINLKFPFYLHSMKNADCSGE